MNALAPGYDFFTYFFTLVLTPGLLLSGVFFPVVADARPRCRRWPTAAAEARDRPRASAAVEHRPVRIVLHVAVLLAYAIGAFYVALVLTRRRLLR
jgi:lipooligosaccharide transport system permease protein